MCAVGIQSGTGDGGTLKTPILIQFEVGIHPPDPVVTSAEFAVGVDGADRGLIEDVAADACDGEGGTVARVRIRRRKSLARRPVITGQNPDSPWAGFSRESEAILGMAYAPRKDEIDRCREEVAVLEEERPLLGKEHLEALVDGDLGLVGLDLAEIRIDCGIQ